MTAIEDSNGAVACGGRPSAGRARRVPPPPAPQAMALAVQAGYYVVSSLAAPVSRLLSGVASRSAFFQARSVQLARAMDLRYQKRKFGGLITELDEERAAKRGGEVLGEAIVVGLGLAVTIHQVQRAAKLEIINCQHRLKTS